ncbi:HD domain-containing protein [Metabacillus halosaccharovorans]|uniref:HD domain-containing protein n=1 Tax=Metabacillus halosaccharovorans TaxID=930124 RepID=A0ABT3DJ35_9BACI|nr:HD domain-containing protein [Metabacillus halosaccharovorans]MCV9886883.1 HD domain-containing protein [Metabacillus halosaccharovorans]
MRRVSLIDIFTHPIAQKYLTRSGVSHAITVAQYAVQLANKYDVNPDLAAKAGLLHDIGHYEWYTDGEWDYDAYVKNDIHAIKGAERAHKLLIRLGEDRKYAKEIALAILLHTDSYLPENSMKKNTLQQIVRQADEMDEEPFGKHHYRKMKYEDAFKQIERLDYTIEQNMSEYRQSV